MANLQTNQTENNYFNGLPTLVFILFAVVTSPILYFVLQMILGNDALFSINGAK